MSQSNDSKPPGDDISNASSSGELELGEESELREEDNNPSRDELEESIRDPDLLDRIRRSDQDAALSLLRESIPGIRNWEDGDIWNLYGQGLQQGVVPNVDTPVRAEKEYEKEGKYKQRPKGLKYNKKKKKEEDESTDAPTDSVDVSAWK